MSTHANDVAHVMREAVISYSAVGSASELHWTPNPEQGFPNRDGLLEFVAVPHDCLRGFRVTVEAIPLDESFRLQDDFNEEAKRRAATDDLFRVKSLVEQLRHSLKPNLLHRDPPAGGPSQTLGRDRPHEPWCVPCQFWAVLDPARDLRAKP